MIMKCPYCNKRVSKSTNTCPHCKRAIDHTNTTVYEVDTQEPEAKPKKSNIFKTIFMPFVTFWTKYIDYTSRATVGEFWIAYAFNCVICCALSFVSWWVVSIYALAMLVPLITLALRRFNDVGFPLVFIFLSLIPAGGAIALLIMCSLPTDFYRKRTDLHD